MERFEYFSHGKLLLSGEYLVLDGAKALALPTTFGQSLKIEENNSAFLKWRSATQKGELWFEQEFYVDDSEVIPRFELETEEEKAIQERLIQIFTLIIQERSLSYLKGFDFYTQLDFPRHWGLGTSSTLIQNLADWTGMDPYFLLENTFGGSGYDLACASAETPIFFRRKPSIEAQAAPFDPPFADDLFFVYLNQKQNSRRAITAYRQQKNHRQNKAIEEVSKISEELARCQNLHNFENLIDRHERLLSGILNRPTVKQERFPDFEGSLKSLGAWGGDFILATGGQSARQYFTDKGFETVLGFRQMLKAF